MESFVPKGLRKGAWAEEEDILLRECVLKFGEGRWHQVPMRAGLNRCRKSCRLRWLNYLKPSIKRGDFEEDEVDLILKLHRLLGNRWSLIAGRIPGRTGNDIKNYWNTHLKKNKRRKQQQQKNRKNLIDSNNVNMVKVTVFRPRPQTFSKTTPWVWKNKDNTENVVNNPYEHTITCSDIQNQISSLELMMNHESDNWWETLLLDEELEQVMNDHINNHNSWETLLLNDDDDINNATGKKD